METMADIKLDWITSWENTFELYKSRAEIFLKNGRTKKKVTLSIVL
jgi:hypothetical protein